ncbi:MAG: hypothetical protein IJU14_01460 [Clostridia bacterium]|nr:hypothetical protein [Clostridia bacterium]
MKLNVKTHFLFLLHCALKVLICSAVGLVLLILVYLIPTQKTDDNVRKSAQEFFDYSAFNWLIGENTDSLILDNYTDSWILLESAYDTRSDENSVWQNAVAVKNSTINEFIHSKNAILLNHYLKNTPFDGTETYPRYWHGYLIFTKPLFFFIHYRDFRIINAVVQFLLFAVLLFLLIKKRLFFFILPYIVSCLLLKPVELFLSMQFSACYYVCTISCIVLLLFGEKITVKQLCSLFLYTGIALAYFDFLTYPLVTVGIPAVMYFSITKTKNLKTCLSHLMGIFVCWGFGYGFMWFLKWLWASVILRQNIFFDAYDSIMYRTVHESYSRWETVKMNFDNFFNNSFITTLFVVLIVTELFLAIFTFIRSKKNTENIISVILPFAILFVLPFLWYVVLTNHSYLHSWFTYRSLMVSSFALSCLLAKLTLHFNS